MRFAAAGAAIAGAVRGAGFDNGVAYGNDDYLKLWRTLEADPKVEEVIRNFPIRQPVLWL